MNEIYDRAGPEPRVKDMLRDPLVRLILRRDGIDDRDVMSAVNCARTRLGLETDPVPVPPPAWCCAVTGVMCDASAA